jgi:hypothetical protein
MAVVVVFPAAPEVVPEVAELEILDVEPIPFGIEVIVRLALWLPVRLKLLLVVIDDVPVATAALKALNEESPAVILTGMNGGGPLKLGKTISLPY